MTMQAKYTEEQRAVALAYYEASEHNLRKTSRDCHIPLSTLQKWVKGGSLNSEVSRKVNIKKGELADRLESLAHSLIDAAPDKIADASLQMIATSLGIAVDKMQLLRSKPTEIIEDASLSDTERAERINAILERARSRRIEQSAQSEVPGESGLSDAA